MMLTVFLVVIWRRTKRPSSHLSIIRLQQVPGYRIEPTRSLESRFFVCLGIKYGFETH